MHPVSISLVRLLKAWEEFKASHNLNDPKVKCCDKTQDLFVALELFEEAVTEDAQQQLNQGDKGGKH